MTHRTGAVPAPPVQGWAQAPTGRSSGCAIEAFIASLSGRSMTVFDGGVGCIDHWS